MECALPTFSNIIIESNEKNEKQVYHVCNTSFLRRGSSTPSQNQRQPVAKGF